MTRVSAQDQQRGMTLIEIMIALAISTVVIGAAIQILIGSKQNYRMIESMSRIQEDARYIMDMIAVDVRMAGTRVCGETNGTSNVITGAAGGNPLDIFNAMVQGYENGAGVSGLPGSGAGSTLVANTDVLRVKNVDTQNQYFVTAHDPGTSTITLSDTPGFSTGDIAIVCDPDFTSAFKVSGIASGSDQIFHASGSGNDSSTIGNEYSAIAQVFKGNTVQYYVGVGADGSTPGLYRSSLEGGVMTSRELIPGIEDMQLSFGEDTDDDSVIDAYRAAGSVVDWDAVTSVRLNLVFRSQDDNIVDSTQNYVLEGATVTPNPADRRLRRVFSSTIAIRNRLPE